MRLISFFFLLVLGISCATPNKTVMNTAVLNGDWTPIKQEIGGKELPAAAFEKQKLIIRDSNYTLIAESTDKGVVKYAGNKMDIYGKEGVNTGKHFTAIYKMENEQLIICYNLAGNIYPDTFDTKGKPLYFLSAFKKN